MKKLIAKAVVQAVAGLAIQDRGGWTVEYPADESRGDYSLNAALKLAGQEKIPPRELAEKIAEELKQDEELMAKLEKIDIAGPGFINFYVSKEHLLIQVEAITGQGGNYAGKSKIKRKILVEFAHPNPLKPFHIGHLRNIITGECVVRLLENQGANVVRANYQGDVGLHIAKAVWGIINKIKNEKLKMKNYGTGVKGHGIIEELKEMEEKPLNERVDFLGEAYVFGHKNFEENEVAKAEIILINKKIYQKDPEIVPVWKIAREWSLKYFETIYRRVYSHFDRLYMESEAADLGKKIVLENVGKIFKKSDGAIIFEGKKHGLHNRVFISSEGFPTYEGKEMGLAKLEFEENNPDLIIHLVGPEQKSFFAVTFEATARVFPRTRGKAKHLIYGFVQLKQGKMSSRRGNVVLGEWLLDEVKKRLGEKYSGRISDSEPVAVAAVKYSFLKVGLPVDIAFDINESISLEGDSGPYLQYAFARTHSVLAKVKRRKLKGESSDLNLMNKNITNEELAIMRLLPKFPEVAEAAAMNYSPNLLCAYLFDLAQKYNNFYNQHRILDSENEAFRLRLNKAVGIVLKKGLNLLGIEVLEKW